MSPLVFVLVIIAIVLFALAAAGRPVVAEGRRPWHLGWLGLALVALAWLLASTWTSIHARVHF